MGQTQSHCQATPTNGLKYTPKRRSIPPPIQKGHRGTTRVPLHAVQRRKNSCTFDKKKCEDLSEVFTQDTSATTVYTTTLDVSNCCFLTPDNSSNHTSLSSSQGHEQRPQNQQRDVDDDDKRRSKQRSKSRRRRSTQTAPAEPILPAFVTVRATEDFTPPLICFPTCPKCESCQQILAGREDQDTVLVCMHFM